MPLAPGKPKLMPDEPRTGRTNDTRKAVVEDAGMTEGEDRDLVYGDGGALGLGEGEDLNEDD